MFNILKSALTQFHFHVIMYMFKRTNIIENEVHPMTNHERIVEEFHNTIHEIVMDEVWFSCVIDYLADQLSISLSDEEVAELIDELMWE